MSNLTKLIEYGQSYWLDNLTRSMIKSGELKKRITKEALRGLTSNPAIFHKAISEGNHYNKQIEKLVKEGKSVLEIYDALTIKDVQDACDLFKTVYESSNGVDGYVSLEVSPYLAHNTEETLSEARRLFTAVNRPNCYIKIPGTSAGISAIEQALYEGISVNVTLLFSIKAYEEVAYAYINALERRFNEGKYVNNVTSVASFFLSRIDTLTDQLLGELINPQKDFGNLPRPEQLLGKTASASAKLAYQSFLKIFSGERWEKLAAAGAKVQRLLWASTSTKDPLYPDTKYVDPLIGPNTVNTLPEITVSAFADHGKLEENAILKNVDGAYRVLDDLKKLGIDIDLVTTQLTNDGIQKFVEPFDKLMKKLAHERLKILEDKIGTQKFFYGKSEFLVKSALNSLNDKQFSRRLFSKDSFLWKDDPEISAAIKNRLGWLGVEDFINLNRADEINAFVKNVLADKFTFAVLLGMGGSSLCPVVASQTFGVKKGYLKLFVLDNTSPEAVKHVESQIDLNKTLFIVASKSGSTIESNSFYKYFYNLYKKNKNETPGKHFIAITDKNTSLEHEAKSKNFRYIFINPEDIGGRYSALSYFGLVPMALIGINIKEILNSAYQMKQSCSSFIPSDANPAVSLGVFLGINFKLEREKVTFVLSPSIKSFGLWVEQLIAESTGKEGKGILPVEGEFLGSKDQYGKDRIFVYMYIKKEFDSTVEKKLAALEAAGFPIVRIMLPDVYSLGGEFLRWEIATATACAIIGVNPFDEPNVSESKKNTNDLLTEWKKNGKFAETIPIVKADSISIYADQSLNLSGRTIKNVLKKFLKLTNRSDYIALLAYFLQTQERDKYLQIMRNRLSKNYKTATTIGYGPRYLHSTGQLHKGGPNSGLFILLTSDLTLNLQIPESGYDFATLQLAQALGDFRSLINKNRRVIRIHLSGDLEQGMKSLSKFL